MEWNNMLNPPYYIRFTSSVHSFIAARTARNVALTVFVFCFYFPFCRSSRMQKLLLHIPVHVRFEIHTRRKYARVTVVSREMWCQLADTFHGIAPMRKSKPRDDDDADD